MFSWDWCKIGVLTTVVAAKGLHASISMVLAQLFSAAFEASSVLRLLFLSVIAFSVTVTACGGFAVTPVFPCGIGVVVRLWESWLEVGSIGTLSKSSDNPGNKKCIYYFITVHQIICIDLFAWGHADELILKTLYRIGNFKQGLIKKTLLTTYRIFSDCMNIRNLFSTASDRTCRARTCIAMTACGWNCFCYL